MIKKGTMYLTLSYVLLFICLGDVETMTQQRRVTDCQTLNRKEGRKIIGIWRILGRTLFMEMNNPWSRACFLEKEEQGSRLSFATGGAGAANIFSAGCTGK